MKPCPVVKGGCSQEDFLFFRRIWLRYVRHYKKVDANEIREQLLNCLDTALQVVVGSLDAWICQDDTAVISTMQVITDDRIEKETLAMMEPSKLMKKKVDISDGVRKKKFVFNTKGKLTKK